MVTTLCVSAPHNSSSVRTCAAHQKIDLHSSRPPRVSMPEEVRKKYSINNDDSTVPVRADELHIIWRSTDLCDGQPQEFT
jgi:hypothetical protein